MKKAKRKVLTIIEKSTQRNMIRACDAMLKELNGKVVRLKFYNEWDGAFDCIILTSNGDLVLKPYGYTPEEFETFCAGKKSISRMCAEDLAKPDFCMGKSLPLKKRQKVKNASWDKIYTWDSDYFYLLVKLIMWKPEHPDLVLFDPTFTRLYNFNGYSSPTCSYV